jgi:CIC family chloride channel protein
MRHESGSYFGPVPKPEDDLNTTLQSLTSLNIDELPVVDPADSGRLLGMLSRRETIAFYNRRVMQHRKEAGRE